MASNDLCQPQPATRNDQPTREPQTEEVVSAELLIEEVSIDGMCGVY